MRIKRFNDLIVWQKGIDLVEQVYLATKGFPREELYGLTSQVRRAAVSIPSNIAEGHNRGSTLEYLRFLSMALGSCAEVETQVVVAGRLKLLNEKQAEILRSRIDEIGRLLHALVKSLERRRHANDSSP